MRVNFPRLKNLQSLEQLAGQGTGRLFPFWKTWKTSFIGFHFLGQDILAIH